MRRRFDTIGNGGGFADRRCRSRSLRRRPGEDDAFDQVVSAGPEDDVYGRLEHLERVVKEERDGGVVGSGANGHRRALKEYEEALQQSS